MWKSLWGVGNSPHGCLMWGVCILGFLVFCHLDTVTAICDCGTDCCAAGNYWTGASCEECTAGFYCVGGALRTPCNKGYANDKNGSTSASDCQSCPAGTFSDAQGLSTCKTCLSGTFSSSVSSSTCSDCPAGSQCPSPFTAATLCLKGYVSVAKSTSCTLCASNEISNTERTACVPCPSGKSCSGPTADPVDCPTGQFSKLGETTCSTCPAGMSCSSPTADPQPCNKGTYSLDGESTCTDCPVFHKCPSTTSAPVKCQVGQYSNSKSLECSDCPAGYKCPDGSQQPTACPLGTYQGATKQADCLDCPAGSYCPTSSFLPIACSNGYYSLAKATGCTMCPPGYFCPSTAPANAASAATECISGTYAEAGSVSCTNCPKGKMCPFTNKNVELDCPAGYFSLGQVANCTLCKAGEACPTKTTTPKVCSSGTFSYAGSRECTDCPAGHACEEIDGSKNVICSAGSYSEAGATKCTPCPPATFCPSTSIKREIPCLEGQYSLGSQTECTECPAGSYCPDNATATIIPCDVGFYSLKNAKQCLPCPEGFFCLTKSSGGIRCQEGFYSYARASVCIICEIGFYCPTTEGSRRAQCPPGSYSSTTGSVTCTACDRGFICPMGSTQPRPESGLCAAGGYCDGKGYIPCPPGTYNPLNGSLTISDCLPCKEGYYCSEPGLTNYVDYVCPKGFYCPVGTESVKSYPCPGGTLSTQIGAESVATCTLCDAGQYCPLGSEVSLPCPAGFFCDQGQPTGDINACPIGTWSNTTQLSTSSQCINCTKGYYCPAGTLSQPRTSQLPCPAGTYNDIDGAGHILNCQPCTPGFACSPTALTNPVVACAAGHYCPAGTINPTDNRCPPGTYSDSTSLSASAQCTACPAGRFCDWATVTQAGNIGQPCNAGFYCPIRTTSADRYPCPAGTFSNTPGLKKADECTICTATNYCLGRETTPSGICPKGYYCPTGTKFATQFPCPAGTYSGTEGLDSADKCSECPLGKFCLAPAIEPQNCPVGTYRNTTNAARQSDCHDCPAGKTCKEEGTITPVGCSIGQYSVAGSGLCVSCPMGFYCDVSDLSQETMFATKKCPSGKFCDPGLSSLSNAIDCPAGRFCPEGTKIQFKCPVGTIRKTVGAAAVTDCEPCTAGFYCGEGSIVTTGPCLAGYYCPTGIKNTFTSLPEFIGSYGDKQVPCPPGTYADSEATTDLDHCKDCTAGKYCEKAQVTPISCPTGFYCDAKSSVPLPCPIGSYGAAPDLESISQCSPCDPGKYCDAPGLVKVRGICDPGYICLSGAKTSTPRDGVTGYVCPARGYCPAGSFNVTSCPQGTYSNKTGSVTEQDCTVCPPGYFCSSEGGGAPTGKCDPGYFCTGRAISPQQNVTQPGYYSKKGATQSTACPLGYYNGKEAQENCTLCDPGYFCDKEAMKVPTLCKSGTYCPPGSTFEQLCPPGTFSAQAGMWNVANCSICTKGFYCQDRGMTSVTGMCRAGHVCFEGALYDDPVWNNDTTKNETIVTWGDVCHPGYYCPEGSHTMYECPIGTYNPDKASHDRSECRPCPGGSYCDSRALSTPAGLCSPGFYCTLGATTPSPSDTANQTGGMCPLHFYCPTGSSQPLYCPAGTYTPGPQQANCTLCPDGSFCEGEGKPRVPCSSGYYCPASRDDNKLLQAIPCPVGTFNPLDGAFTEANCTLCTPGYYCADKGLKAVSGPMDPGSWSQQGAALKAYSLTTGKEGFFGICPMGSYCPNATATPIKCPIGTYGNQDGLTALSECTQCPAGYACKDFGSSKCDMAAQSGCELCDPGYYCTGGSPTRTPALGSIYGGPCPLGSACTKGVQTECPAGQYQNAAQQDKCKDCDVGYYCPPNTTNPIECPPGYYCLQSTTDYTTKPCPAGNYQNATKAIDATWCRPCPAGSYCDTPALTNVRGPCNSGFYCPESSISATQTRCQRGYFCPNGSADQQKCTPGFYCPTEELSAATLKCSEGYYCPGGDSVDQENICPIGQYCISGAAKGEPCPTGTFRNAVGGKSSADCGNCTAGYYCATPGLSVVTKPCVQGFYCPSGQTQADPPVFQCPEGHYCEAGSAEPSRCKSGEYQPLKQKWSCLVCQEGYFCDNTGTNAVTSLSESNLCPPGYYCPKGTLRSQLFPCPMGTFNSKKGLVNETQCEQCLGGKVCDEKGLTAAVKSCTPGYFCRRSAKSSTPSQGEDANSCPIGFYCPLGSIDPTPCPSGTYSTLTLRSDKSECTPCTAGMFCPFTNMTTPPSGPSFMCSAGYFCPNASSIATQVDCPLGHFCPPGSAEPTACSVGTIANLTQRKSSGDCMKCLAGFYCDSPGSDQPTAKCTPGYYCEEGSSKVSAECPENNYCPEGSASPQPCPSGQYAPNKKSVTCTQCPSGSYCDDTRGLFPCPRGFYCPAGTAKDAWSPCPIGTLGTQPGLGSADECSLCPARYACPTPGLQEASLLCSAGYWCFSGAVTDKPTGGYTSLINNCTNTQGGSCPLGHYCPSGTSNPIPCEVGKYADKEGLSQCSQCPPGHYCPPQSSSYLDKVCYPRFYCMAGSAMHNQSACPEGTYSNASKLKSESECTSCPGGYYCAGVANLEPTGKISGGYYSSGSATTSTPQGGECSRGNYCPEGSSNQKPCPAGMYCATDFLSQPSGNCSAGYFCQGSASLSEPFGDGTGDECPAGKYCPVGVVEPILCPSGRYRAEKRGMVFEDCKKCPAGYYCSGNGQTSYTAGCAAGYYCPEGQSTDKPADYICPAGFKCPAESSQSIVCDSGTYQPLTGQSDCVICPPGYYCDNTNVTAPTTDLSLSNCPKGHYCLEGTWQATLYPCPQGTFNDQLNLKLEKNCQPCSPGKYCMGTGLSQPNGPCDAGYFCQSGALTSTPTQGDTANACPIGFYCPEDTSTPISCPIGRYGTQMGLKSLSDCRECDASKFCPHLNATAPGPNCQSGYYCPIGADKSAFIDCPPGFYCPPASSSAIPCPAGTFSKSLNLNDASQCISCTPGSYCSQTNLTNPDGTCLAGFYCPEKSTSSSAHVCPIALHCPAGSPQPKPCLSGTYTELTQQASCKPCPAGFYCLPVEVANGGSVRTIKCPMGKYCPEGTGTVQPMCPSGTYSTLEGRVALNDCKQCDGGSYCDEAGATRVKGNCEMGYFCVSGVDTKTPNNVTNKGEGGICPAGSFCPLGSVHPKPCSAGTFQDQTGQTQCLPCQAGYYCPANTLNTTAHPCPKGHYCLAGTSYAKQYPCPRGSFNSAEGKSTSSDCKPCPAGRVCDGIGLPDNTGPCAPGWYCTKGAEKATPSVSDQGGQCTPGYYCPEGSSKMTECPGGYYCEGVGQANVTGMCVAGYYCPSKATQKQPPAWLCPAGSYCPEASATFTKCPVGRYGNARGLQADTNCTLCDAGQYCDKEGLLTPTSICASGYYCPQGQVTDTPANYVCEPGHFCIGSKGFQEECPAGQYQDRAGQSSCNPCLPGYFCPTTGLKNSTTQPCPQGHYCLQGSSTGKENPCPQGTYNSLEGRTSASQCQQCSAGYACPTQGIVTPTEPCKAGYYCKSGAKLAIPVNQAPNAGLCPQGSYCPANTGTPELCAAGTYSKVTGLKMQSQCTNCDPKFYCDKPGQSSTTGLCSKGYYCPGNSTSPTQIICDAGHYCAAGSYSPTPCPIGTLSNTTGLSKSDQCEECPAGSFCSSLGITSPSGPCDPGYYCPKGSITAQEKECLIGTYCPSGSPNYLLCPSGLMAAKSKSSSCEPCPEGYYCVPDKVVLGNVATVKIECPSGYYCFEQTGNNMTMCPLGTFSSDTKLTSPTKCKPCTGGQYCSSQPPLRPTAPCSAGFYCTSGSTSATPTMNANCTEAGQSVLADICPAGYRCPSGSDKPTPCEEGTYQDNKGESTCKPCQAGYFCTNTTTAMDAANLCPQGYFCPAGTKAANANPCPEATFNNKTGQTKQDACIDCPAGFYCSGIGNPKPTNVCKAGYYCPLKSTSETAQKCPVGNFCPTGSPSPIKCTSGSYCSLPGLTTTKGLCDPGYYCTAGSASKQQNDCPIGHYCLSGSVSPSPCEIGRFSNVRRVVKAEDCQLCSEGYYCNSRGASAVTNKCNPGYYCPPAQIVPSPITYICQPGYACSGGKGSPELCPLGQYQDEQGQSACKTCLPGFYCDNTDGPVTNLTGRECPSGYYCPSGTKQKNEYPCKRGTFNDKIQSTSEAACQSCSPGFACTDLGLPTPNTECMAGYYCPGGNTLPNSTTTMCPVGSYCPQGVSKPVQCPVGTFNYDRGSTSNFDCKACPSGQYCTPQLSATGSTNPCQAGFVCVNNATVPNPTDGTTGYLCPKGNYCPAACGKEIKCMPGTYAPTDGAEKCDSCPAGYTCPSEGMSVGTKCPLGHYCEPGTQDDGISCPIGTFNNQTELSLSSECSPCTPGQFCDATGLSVPKGPCQPGYLCIQSAQIATPNDGATGTLCPPGSYCLSGTVSPIPCPPGTLRRRTGAAAEADCEPCDGGYFCQESGLTSPTGLCSAGYFCPVDAKVDTPTPSEFACTVGFHCPGGTAQPLVCPDGQYQPAKGQSSCLACPSGSYCINGTEITCPAFSYCPSGSKLPSLCPSGRFTEVTKLGTQSAEQCAPCPAGRYCTGGQNQGYCEAGYWCRSESPFSNVTFPVVGPSCPVQLCPVGYYCPLGATQPKTCPPGKVITIEGAASDAECQICPQGYFCPPNSTLAQECTPGHYCPASTIDPLPCPKYTYNDKYKATDDSLCLTCPAGTYCPDNGTSSLSAVACRPGNYCPLKAQKLHPCPKGTFRNEVGAAKEQDCTSCTAGYYCPNTTMISVGPKCSAGYYCPPGTIEPELCPDCYYCGNSTTKTACPAGYFCPNKTGAIVRCPTGHYCGVCSGTAEKIICPMGYREKLNAGRITFDDTCEQCPPGQYGNATDRSLCSNCRAGVICLAGALSDEPSFGADYLVANSSHTRAYPCPIGNYCPAGSVKPVACPAGRYSPKKGGQDLETGCPKCSADYFQNQEGQSVCFSCGGQAYQNVLGSATCKCVGGGRDFQISDRTCPCRAGFQAIDSKPMGECAKIVYPLCTRFTYREPYGACWNLSQWETYCRDQGCLQAADYLGVDTTVPMCLCQQEEMEEVCDTKCRFNQQNQLTVHCPMNPLPPFVRISNPQNKMIVEISISDLRNLINWDASLGSSQFCTNQLSTASNFSSPAFITETSALGFLGVYQPNTTQLVQLLTANIKPMSPQPNFNITGRVEGGLETRRRKLLATSDTSGSTFRGILNPITCLDNGATMMWSVTKEHYPVYDDTNLLNTNAVFDASGFRRLVEDMAQTTSSASLFSFRFTDAGTYAFKLSSNAYRIMYIRVMPANTKCSVIGPFFPSTPLNFIQTGIRQKTDILLEPDWVSIGIFFGCLIAAFIIFLVIIILLQRCGWSYTLSIRPFYRYLSVKKNFDEYATEGTRMQAYTKAHPNHEGVGLVGEMHGAVIGLVDLQGFSSSTVYSILEKQSIKVTHEIEQQKTYLKEQFLRLSKQTSSLRHMWISKTSTTNQQSSSGLSAEEEEHAFQMKKNALDTEISRRRTLGNQFSAQLRQQIALIRDEETNREKHEVEVSAMFDEMQSLLAGVPSSSSHNIVPSSEEAQLRCRQLASRVKSKIATETERTGHNTSVMICRLIDPDTKKPYDPEQLVAEMASSAGLNENVRRVVKFDSKLGYYVPIVNEAKMITPDGTILPVPVHAFLHPITGAVVPQMGNLVYDSATQRFILASQSVNPDVPFAKNATLPYLPHPLEAHVRVQGLGELPGGSMEPGGVMICSQTGLPCPILAVSLHPRTGELLPIGGTHVDPVTGQPVAIEIGGLMVDPHDRTAIPVLGIGFDGDSGHVYPVGQSNLYLFASFVNPWIKHKMLLLTHLSLNSESMMPSSGGHTGFTLANVLSHEIRILDILQNHLKTNPTVFSLPMESFTQAIQQLELARSLLKQDLLSLLRCFELRLDQAANLSSEGDCKGWYEMCPGTGRLLPLLFGTPMTTDTGVEVPILGYQALADETVKPLGGTLEDPEGTGQIPINLGGTVVDIMTGALTHVVGIQEDPVSGIVQPVTVVDIHKNKNQLKSNSEDQWQIWLTLLEEEALNRKSVWNRLDHIRQDILIKQLLVAFGVVYHNTTLPTDEELESSFGAIRRTLNDFQFAIEKENTRRQNCWAELKQCEQPDASGLTVNMFWSLRALCDNDIQESSAWESAGQADLRFITNIQALINSVIQEDGEFWGDSSDDDEGGNQAKLSLHIHRSNNLRDRMIRSVLLLFENMEHHRKEHSYWSYRGQLLLGLSRDYFIKDAEIVNGDITGDLFCCFFKGQLTGSKRPTERGMEDCNDQSQLGALLRQAIDILNNRDLESFNNGNRGFYVDQTLLSSYINDTRENVGLVKSTPNTADQKALLISAHGEISDIARLEMLSKKVIVDSKIALDSSDSSIRLNQLNKIQGDLKKDLMAHKQKFETRLHKTNSRAEIENEIHATKVDIDKTLAKYVKLYKQNQQQSSDDSADSNQYIDYFRASLQDIMLDANTHKLILPDLHTLDLDSNVVAELSNIHQMEQQIQDEVVANLEPPNYHKLKCSSDFESEARLTSDWMELRSQLLSDAVDRDLLTSQRECLDNLHPSNKLKWENALSNAQTDHIDDLAKLLSKRKMSVDLQREQIADDLARVNFVANHSEIPELKAVEQDSHATMEQEMKPLVIQQEIELKQTIQNHLQTLPSKDYDALMSATSDLMDQNAALNSVKVNELMDAQQKARQALRDRVYQLSQNQKLLANQSDDGNNNANLKLANAAVYERYCHAEMAVEAESKNRIDHANGEIKDIESGRSNERKDLVASLANILDGFDEANADEAKTNPSKFAENRKAFLDDHNKVLEDFDNLTKELLDRCKEDISKRVDVKHGVDLHSLKVEKYQELIDLHDKFGIKSEDKKLCQDLLDFHTDQLNKYLETQGKFTQTTVEIYHEQKALKEQALQNKLANLQDASAHYSEEERENLNLRQEAEREALEDQLGTKLRRQLDTVDSETDRKRIMAQHRDQEKVLKDQLENQQNSAREALQAKLAALRKSREENSSEAAEVYQKEQINEDDTLRHLLYQKKMNETPEEPSTPPPDPLDLLPSTSENWLLRLLESSPLGKTMSEVEQLMQDKNLGNHGNAHLGTSGSDDSSTSCTDFVDEKDAQFKNEGKLEVCLVSRLTGQQLGVYQVGQITLEAVSKEINGDDPLLIVSQLRRYPIIRFLVADKLPHNNYTGNGFRNSVFYEQATGTLFIRRQRLDNVGDFIVILLHSIAHVCLHDDLKHDANPLHTKYFYKLLRIVYRHLIFPRHGLDITGQLPTPLDPSFTLRVLQESTSQLPSVPRQEQPPQGDADSESSLDLDARIAAYEKSLAQYEVHSLLATSKNQGYRSIRDRLDIRRQNNTTGKSGSRFPVSDLNLDFVREELANLNKDLESLNVKLTEILRLEVSGSSPPSADEEKRNLLTKLGRLDVEIRRRELQLQSALEATN